MAIIQSIKSGNNNTHLQVTAFPLADANGNCVSFIDEAGNVQAHYVYDAFGGTASPSGDMDDVFSFRFSSKYLDDETGLYFYGFRYYSPVQGRWLSRDPIDVLGGINIYLLANNNIINLYDMLGLAPNCTPYTREEFEKWLSEELGATVDSVMKGLLDRGCIGVPCADTGRRGYPEAEGSTSCWLSESEARDKGCKECEKNKFNTKCVVFAKQGSWKEKGGPKKKSDGSVSCDSVKTSTPRKRDWNYIHTKSGYYIYANGGKVAVDEQTFYVCKKDPSSDIGYDATMWVATCIAKCNIPGKEEYEEK